MANSDRLLCAATPIATGLTALNATNRCVAIKDIFSMLGSAILPAATEEAALEPALESTAQAATQNLDRFLASVEKRAFQMARIALRDTDEALDVVQDAMLQLARRYSARPCEEWRPLFYRILQNRIHDSQRRRMVRNKFFGWLPGRSESDDNEQDPMENIRDERAGPIDQIITGEAMSMLEQALQKLPARQLQVFMLRNLEGLDVAETALSMGCSQGSVKTHYSRAVHTLRAQLSDSWGAELP